MAALRGNDFDLESDSVLCECFQSAGLALGSGAKSLSSSEGSDGNVVDTAVPANEKSNENDPPPATGAAGRVDVHTVFRSVSVSAAALLAPATEPKAETTAVDATTAAVGEGPNVAPPRRFAFTIARDMPDLRRPQGRGNDNRTGECRAASAAVKQMSEDPNNRTDDVHVSCQQNRCTAQAPESGTAINQHKRQRAMRGGQRQRRHPAGDHSSQRKRVRLLLLLREGRRSSPRPRPTAFDRKSPTTPHSGTEGSYRRSGGSVGIDTGGGATGTGTGTPSARRGRQRCERCGGASVRGKRCPKQNQTLH
jgi:hypothetical protein